MKLAKRCTAMLALSLGIGCLTVPLVPAQAATSVDVAMSAAKVRAGERAYLSGRVAGDRDGLTVQLERKVPGEWVSATKPVRLSDGAFSLRVPTGWYGSFRYRTVVRAGSEAVATSAAQRLQVLPAYRPDGQASDHVLASPTAVVRWNPCRPIRYRVNLAQATPGALRDVRSALSRVRQATGLRFVYKGTTDTIPKLLPRQRWPKATEAVIAWARPSQAPYLGGSYGFGGTWFSSGYMNGAGAPVQRITRGYVVLDSTRRLAPGFGGGATRGHLLMHEIGHMVGLQHSRGEDQIMTTFNSTARTRFGAGDLAGLAKVGANQGCVVPADNTGGIEFLGRHHGDPRG